MNRHNQQVLESTATGSALLDLLPDDSLVAIGTTVGKFCGITDYIHLGQSCQRIHRLLLSSDEVISDIIRYTVETYLSRSEEQQEDVAPDDPIPKDNVADIKTLEQLSLFERLHSYGLMRDNRIRFHFDTMDIDHSDGSFEKIAAIPSILEKYEPYAISVVLDAHCGTQMPSGIAEQVSWYRGQVVVDEICKACPYVFEEYSINVHGWGKRAVTAAARSQHPYSEHARSGEGWVEIHFQILGNQAGEVLELPFRPDYYNSAIAEEENEERSDMVVNYQDDEDLYEEF
mmetsp:Transcript_20547/g.33043  ORF Transcript_20547/g.33043 Transcript_20547/m.33043 type:complete len:287 (+) Transcript_20547:116-976(+)